MRAFAIAVYFSISCFLIHENFLFANEDQSAASQSLILVIGAAGNAQYEISFYQWSERWVAAARQGNLTVTVIGRHRGEGNIEITDYDRLRETLRQSEGESNSELWIVLIGHGTFDRRAAKFNLRGPDFSAEDLAEWLKPIKRPTAIINCSSGSGAFLSILSGPNRVVVTATKSGSELNFSRFGDHLSRAICDPKGDLDKDSQTSLWEAFLLASRNTAEYYDSEGRVATEHALLDDNGDQRGTRADQFKGLAPINKPEPGLTLDGRHAKQWHLVFNESEKKLSMDLRARRNKLEITIENLRDQKELLSADNYWKRLEELLILFSELYETQER